MRKVLLVARHEFLTNLRRPGFIFMTLFVPVLGLVGLAVVSLAGGRAANLLRQQFAPEGYRIAYVDHSGLFSPALPQYKTLFSQYSDEGEALRALRDRRESTVMVFPADYVQTGKVAVYSLRSGFSGQVSSDSATVRSFLVDHLVAGRLDSATTARLRDPLNAVPVMLDKDGKPSGEGTAGVVLGFVIPYLMSILLIMTIFTSSGYLLQGIGTEKDSRVIELLVSSLTSTQLMAGKILGLGALGLLQVLFWVLSGWGLLILASGLLALVGALPISLQQVGLSIMYFLLGYLLFGTLMAAAGALGTSMREGQQIAGIFSLGAALPFMAISFIFANPNSTLAVLLSYCPFSAPVTMMLRLGLTHVPWYQLVISTALLVGAVLISLWAGAKVFRLGLLMYGKRASPTEIWRALRQA
jgi:ABC-2 type transport system permease protein